MAENIPSVESIFHAALTRDDPFQRAAFLDRACADNLGLRTRVERLLDAHGHAGGFLETPVVDLDATIEPISPPTSALEGPGTVIGNYKLLERIGEGGFGVVYMADQQQPVRRRVALKIIKLGMDTRQVIARFEAERQALAMMDHPNIAKVLDAGASNTGRPYFVMELVRGVPINEYCDNNRLTTRERLELFLPICHAVQHAHQKGIIHRDLKPSNVLVTLHDGRPVPKVIDFGIAKATSYQLTDKTFFTGFREFIGTPEFMSPDQASVSGLDVDTRTDIYSLGVLLYVLLTGKTPFDVQTLRKITCEEIQRIIREVDPPKPSTRISTLGEELGDVALHRRIEPDGLRKLLRGDLDSIVMKAMEKDRTRRYGTANEFAADIRRHLNHEPVWARPPSATYRLQKFVRRHQLGVAGGALATAALLVGFSAAAFGLMHANRARAALQNERDVTERARVKAVAAQEREHDQRTLAETAAEEARREAKKSAALASFLQDMLASVDPSVAQGREVTVRYVLDEAAKKIAGGGLKEQAEVEAAVRTTLGKTYVSLGLIEDADEHLQTALAMRRELLGDNHPDTLTSAAALATAFNAQSKFGRAEILFRQTLNAQRRVRGPEHQETLASMNGLGISLWRQGRNAEAVELHRAAFEIQRRTLGEDHKDTLRSMVNLGTALLGMKKLDPAEELLTKALAIERRALGDQHPLTMAAMNNLALTYERGGKLDEAAKLYLDALQRDRRVFGADHPSTQIPLNNLIRVLTSQKRIDELRPYTQALVDGRRRLAERPDADANAMNNYAWLLLTCIPEDLRDPKAALPVAQRAVELDGGKNPNFLDTLAKAYQMSGDLARAIETQRRAVDIAWLSDRYNRAVIEQRLVEYLWERGDWAGVARFTAEAVANRLAAKSQARFGLGAALFLKAEILLAQGRSADAEPFARECLMLREEALPEDHWMIGSARNLLGAILVARDRFEQAEPLLLSSFEQLAERQDNEIRKQQALERLVLLYEAWRKQGEATNWRKQLNAQRSAVASVAPRERREDGSPVRSEEILARYVQALGGKAVWQRAENREVTGSIYVHELQLQMPFVRYDSAPNSTYLAIDVPGVGQLQRGVSGGVAWVVSPEGVAMIAGGQEREARLRGALFNLPVRWNEVYASTEMLGLESVDGVPCYKIQMTPPSGPPEIWYVSEGAHRLLKVETMFPVHIPTPDYEPCCDEEKAIQAKAAKRIPIITYFADFRDVDGIVVAHQITSCEGGRTHVAEIESVRHNVTLPTESFEPPPAVRTLLDEGESTEAAGRPAIDTAE